MDIAWQEWASLLIRWLHLITGIAWIGSSFYFIWLDLSLRRREGLPDGVGGESWSVHGGGFYHVEKYLVAPARMPGELHWFKYESYFTWLSGFALLAVIYYWGAESFLVDPAKLALQPWQAVLASIVFLSAGWVAYDWLCKSPVGGNTALLAAAVFVLLVAGAWGLSEVFSNRAAFLHVGAMIGTMMTGNVFFVIIPNQKKVVADLVAGRTPDPALGRQAKQRSTHNNYLTLPVLLMMVSGHYPVLFGNGLTWAVVGLVILIGGVVRHFFNTMHAGATRRALWWQWPAAAALLVGLVVLVSPRPAERSQVSSVSVAQAMAIVQARCVACHAAVPADADFDRPPAGLTFETPADLRRNAARILGQAVLSTAMPLGNKTGMTAAERAGLGAWIRAGMPDEP